MKMVPCILTALGAIALTPTASAALVLGDTIGIDFGKTASTDPNNTWNNLSVGGNETTAGLADSGTVVLSSGTVLNTSNIIVPDVSFSFTNSSGQIAWDFGTAGNAGIGLFTDSTVYGDSIISNDKTGTPFRPVQSGTDTFVFTFAGLNDALSYELVGGWSHGNGNFEANWSADGQSFNTLIAPGNGYGSLTGLETDGSGNLVITVTGVGGAGHITASGLTLKAVPEPSGTLLFGAGGILLLLRRVRRV